MITAELGSLTGLVRAEWTKLVQGRDHRQGGHPAGLGVRRDAGHRRARAPVPVRLPQDIAGLPGRVTAALPRWLRLTRSGATVTGYDSAGGVHWSEAGSATLAGLPATAQAGGVFATSPTTS